MSDDAERTVESFPDPPLTEAKSDRRQPDSGDSPHWATSALAHLHIEADEVARSDRAEEAAARALGEQLSRLHHIRYRWVEAFEAIARVDPHAKAGQRNQARMVEELTGRLTALAPLLREYETEYAALQDLVEVPHDDRRPQWVERLCHAAQTRNTPRGFRFAYGVLALAITEGPVAVTRELQLIVWPSEPTVFGWWVWLRDRVISPRYDTREPSSQYEVSPPPFADRGGEPAAFQSLFHEGRCGGSGRDGLLIAIDDDELCIDVQSPVRNPGKPSQYRQADILAAIANEGTPLTRPELIVAMRLKTEGKLGANLAWMVTNNILVNIPLRGYWPAHRPIPG